MSFPEKYWTSDDVNRFRLLSDVNPLAICTHLKCHQRAGLLRALTARLDELEDIKAALEDELEYVLAQQSVPVSDEQGDKGNQGNHE